MSRFGASHGCVAYEPWLAPKRLTLVFVNLNKATSSAEFKHSDKGLNCGQSNYVSKSKRSTHPQEQIFRVSVESCASANVKYNIIGQIVI